MGIFFLKWLVVRCFIIFFMLQRRCFKYVAFCLFSKLTAKPADIMITLSSVAINSSFYFSEVLVDTETAHKTVYLRNVYLHLKTYKVLSKKVFMIYSFKHSTQNDQMKTFKFLCRKKVFL